MSASGILFAVFMAASFVCSAADNHFFGFLMFGISCVFGLAATYHDEQQTARIAALEKKLAERGKDDAAN